MFVFPHLCNQRLNLSQNQLVVLNENHALKLDYDEDHLNAGEAGWPCPIFEVYRVPTLAEDESLDDLLSATAEWDPSESEAMLEPARAILTFPCFSSFALHHSTMIESDETLIPYSVDRAGIFYTDTSEHLIRVDVVFTGYQGEDVNPSLAVLLSRSSLLRYVTSSATLPLRVPWNAWSAPVLIGPSRDYPYMHGRAIRALVDTHVDYEEIYSVGSRSDVEFSGEEDDDWERALEGNGTRPHPIRVRDYHRRRTSRPLPASGNSPKAVTTGVHKSYLKNDWITEASPAEEYEEDEEEDEEDEEDDENDENENDEDERNEAREKKGSRDIWAGVRPTLPVNTSSWKYITTDRDPPPELEGKAGGKYLLLDDGLVYVEASRFHVFFDPVSHSISITETS